MSNRNLTVTFVRRGYSPSGGAEAYLKRLARGLVDLGHKAQLITTGDWPPDQWAFGSIHHLPAKTAIAFADEVEKLRPQIPSHVLMSLERLWRCDIFRAGDGVHRAWLQRRRKFELPLQRFARNLNRKHRDLLLLEQSLFGEGGASRVIANSQMVKDEIVDLYRYPANKIEIVRNGVPLDKFRFDPAVREKARTDLKLKPDETALLFAGTGWERKGLRFAVEAMALGKNRQLRLLVAGTGKPGLYKSRRIKFLGEVVDLAPIYAAADIFILPTIYDPFSNACLEAFASGLPVITTRANGFGEVMEDGVHGSIIELASNIEALRDAIQYWSDAQRRIAARSTIIERASQFDITQNVEQTLALLSSIADCR